MECIDKRPTFVAGSFLLVTIIHFAPFGFQIETFLNTVWSDWRIFIVGISIAESVDVISFSLELLAFQCGKITSQIDIIGIVPIFRKDELSGRISSRSARIQLQTPNMQYCCFSFCASSINFRRTAFKSPVPTGII